LTPIAVSEELAGRGIVVYEDSLACAGAEDLVTMLANVVSSGPHENLSEQDEIDAKQGSVHCAIYRESLFGRTLASDLDAPAASPIFSGDKAEFFLANVQCTIYPQGEAKAEQVARLQHVMEALEAQL
jgi:hypothetical protein